MCVILKYIYTTGAAHVELERTPRHVAAPLVSKHVTILHTVEMLSRGVRPGNIKQFRVFTTGAAHVELERTPRHVAAPLVSKHVVVVIV